MFSDITNDFVRDNFKNIKMNSFTKRSAFTDNNNVSFFNWESWRAVYWDISVSFFISIVFWYIMKIISSYDNGSLHFCWNTDSFKDFSSNWNVTCEGAFFVNIGWFNSFFRSSESESDVFKVSYSSCSFFSEEFFSI